MTAPKNVAERIKCLTPGDCWLEKEGLKKCMCVHAAEAEASFQLSSEGVIDYKD